jgi:hypothetical protein
MILVSWGQCCSSRTRHWQIFTLNFCNTRPIHLIWPLQTTTFPNFKRRKFLSIKEAILAADWLFAAQPKEFFLDGLK